MTLPSVSLMFILHSFSSSSSVGKIYSHSRKEISSKFALENCSVLFKRKVIFLYLDFGDQPPAVDSLQLDRLKGPNYLMTDDKWTDKVLTTWQ